jgi:hypothetical protein
MTRWIRVWAGIALSASGLTLCLPSAPRAMGAVNPPACRATQMTVTLGLTREVWTHNSVMWNGWVRYTNEGSACLMSKVDVGVQAVTGPTHIPLGQGSLSDMVARRPFVLDHHAAARALVQLIEPLSPVAYSCLPVAIDAIEITGYLYGWPTHYFSVTRWRELGLCTGDHLAAVGGVLTPISPPAVRSSPTGPPATTNCSLAQLRVKALNVGAAGGNNALLLAYTNTGARRCWIRGYARVTVYGAPHAEVAIDEPSIYLGGLEGLAGHVVTLRTEPVAWLSHRQSAYELLGSSDNPAGTATSCPYATSARVRLAFLST